MKKYVDLTLPIIADHFRYKSCVIAPVRSMKNGDEANITHFELASHMFTHIDAPRHKLMDSKTLNEYDPSIYVGPAFIFDVSYVDENEPIDDKKLAKAMDGYNGEKILFVKSCFSLKHDWKTPDFWQKSPYITAEGAVFLRELQPNIVGFDFAQDYEIRNKGQKKNRYTETHELILKEGIPMIEYMNFMWKLPVNNVEVYALPLNLPEADGAQIRVIAAYDDCA